MASCSNDKPAHSSSNFVIIFPSFSICIHLYFQGYLLYVPILLLLFFLNFLAMPHGLWNLSSPTRECTLALGGESRVLTTGLPGKFLCINSYIDFIPARIYLNSKSIVWSFLLNSIRFLFHGYSILLLPLPESDF